MFSSHQIVSPLSTSLTHEKQIYKNEKYILFLVRFSST